jgi:hypothetical protein
LQQVDDIYSNITNLSGKGPETIRLYINLGIYLSKRIYHNKIYNIWQAPEGKVELENYNSNEKHSRNILSMYLCDMKISSGFL